MKYPHCDNRFNYTLEQGISNVQQKYLRNACVGSKWMQMASCWQIKPRLTATIERRMKSNKQHQKIAQLNWVNEVKGGGASFPLAPLAAEFIDKDSTE